MNAAAILVGAAAYGVAAWLGMLLGETLCAGTPPLPGRPVQVMPPTLLFAGGGAMLGASVVLHGLPSFQLATLALVTVALAAAAAADLSAGIVPDLVTLVPLGALLLSSAIRAQFGPLLSAFVVIIPFAGVAALSKGRGLGWGDVKLAALGAAILGARGAMFALASACVAAFVVSRVVRPQGRPIALAPYLVVGICVDLAVEARA